MSTQARPPIDRSGRPSAGFRPVIVMPAFNESATLAGVLAEIARALPGWQTIVISDGSRDDTAAIGRANGAIVLDLPFNLGVGAALRTGFLYAVRHGYTHVVQLDADGQHDPATVPVLLGAAAETGADIVIGARFAGEGDFVAKGPRRWAMKMLAAVLSGVCRTKLTDTTSGFKVLGPKALALFSYDYPSEYLGDTVEALVIAARHHLVVRQAAVTMRPRQGGTPSQAPWKASIFLLRAMVVLAIAFTRPAERRPAA